MSFREKKNKEALVFQSTGLGVILAEPSLWKALILQHLIYLCLSGERDMPFLSLFIRFTAVPNTPYTFLLLALPTLPRRLFLTLFGLTYLGVSMSLQDFELSHVSPVTLWWVHFFLDSSQFSFFFSFMENNYSDCGFAPTHHLISSFSYRFHFYVQCKAMAFDYMKHPNCSSTHAVLSVSLWGKHVCFAFLLTF